MSSEPKSRQKHVAVVVGSGFGCRIQIPALKAAGFEVSALVGTDPERTAERARANGVPLAFTDLDEAIRQTGATVVTVATPPDTHAPMVHKAIGHGCHVLCEKPFAMNVAEGRAMLEAAEAAGVIHALGYEFRWDPARAAAERLIAEGAIGEPRIATFTQFMHYAGNPYVDLPDWWLNEKSGGGWLGAWGSHLVDWVHTWLGDFTKLSAALPSVGTDPGEAEDSYIVRFELANGLQGTFQQSSGAWGPPAAMNRVAGTRGTLWIEGESVQMADAEGERTAEIPGEFALPPMPSLSDEDPRRQTPEWQMLTQVELPAYIRLCETLRNAIEGEDQGPVAMATFADGVRAMVVLDAIRRSAELGGEQVKIDY